MNKVSLQSFSVGIIFATSIIAGFYYGTNSNEKVTFTTTDAKKMLEGEGYQISKIDASKKSDEKEKNIEPKEETKNIVKTRNEQVNKKKEKVISYILKVKSKMTASEIAELLEKEKIIDDATKFRDYMNKKSLSQKVQIGEYIVSSDMNDEELSKLITK